MSINIKSIRCIACSNAYITFNNCTIRWSTYPNITSPNSYRTINVDTVCWVYPSGTYTNTKFIINSCFARYIYRTCQIGMTADSCRSFYMKSLSRISCSYTNIFCRILDCYRSGRISCTCCAINYS